MKASEVISRYNTGERNFRRVSLRGESFKGQNLADADFSEADIRGANFTNAKLRGAKFCDAKAGLQRRWAISLVAASFLLAVLSGFGCSISGASAGGQLILQTNDPKAFIAAVIILVLSVIFFVIIFFSIFSPNLEMVSKAIAVAVVIAITLVAVLVFNDSVAGNVAGTIVGATAVVLILTVVLAVALVVTGSIANTTTAVVAITLAVTGALAGAITAAITGTVTGVVTLPGALTGTFVWMFLGGYISWRPLKGEERGTWADVWIREIAIAFAATGGTSFYNADLTEADFTGAILKSTDLRKATLTRTRWYKSQKLEHARVGNSILSDAAIRDLLVTGYGYKKSYVKASLRGANLAGTNLSYANFKYADFSEASLVRANLEWSNLTETNAIGTDFTGASLTGACLEAFNIDSKTKLEQVDCRFIYLLEHPNPETGDRERRPHDPNKVFEPGDFAKLYKKVMDTVQILLRNGANSEAFRAAFRQIMEDNPEINWDSIQSVEKKEEDVLVTIQVPEGTDKGKLEQKFDEVYQARLEAQKQTALREAETRHSQTMKEITLAALINNPSTNPIFNVTNEAKSEGKVMNESTDNSRKIENRDGSVAGNILGDSSTISGKVTQSINELPASVESDTPGIKELLTQLQAAIKAEPSLNDEDKAEALEQVKLLAEAGKNPSDGAMKKLAKRATTMLKGLISGLPTAARLLETCQDLLPAITEALDL